MTKKELLESFRESLAGIFADKEAQDDKEIIEFYLEVCCTIAETYAESKMTPKIEVCENCLSSSEMVSLGTMCPVCKC